VGLDFVLPNLGELRGALAALTTTPWQGGPFAEPARDLLARHADP
jgi:hypothetical protein